MSAPDDLAVLFAFRRADVLAFSAFVVAFIALVVGSAGL